MQVLTNQIDPVSVRCLLAHQVPDTMTTYANECSLFFTVFHCRTFGHAWQANMELRSTGKTMVKRLPLSML